MEELEIEVGKYYRTKDGKKVFIIAEAPKDLVKSGFVGLFYDDDETRLIVIRTGATDGVVLISEWVDVQEEEEIHNWPQLLQACKAMGLIENKVPNWGPSIAYWPTSSNGFSHEHLFWMTHRRLHLVTKLLLQAPSIMMYAIDVATGNFTEESEKNDMADQISEFRKMVSRIKETANIEGYNEYR